MYKGIYLPDNFRKSVLKEPERTISFEIWDFYQFDEDIEKKFKKLHHKIHYPKCKEPVITELEMKEYEQLGKTLPDAFFSRCGELTVEVENNSKMIITKEEYDVIIHEINSIQPISLHQMYEIYTKNQY